jgi:hypothetical protein
MSRSFSRRMRVAALVAPPFEDYEQDQDVEDLDEEGDDEDETGESRKAEADQAAAEAERSRTEAARLVADAEAEAGRIVTEARRRADELVATARDADRRAEAARERSGYLTYAAGLRVNVRTAEDLVETLRAEAGELTASVADLDARQAETVSRSEDTTAALATAREAGDIAGVRNGRAELAAVDEVAAVLTGQRDRAAGRLADIGPADGTGELSKALSAAERVRADLSDALDHLDPSRIEARKAALMASFMEQNGGDAAAAALLTVAATDPELVRSAYSSPSPDQGG